MNSNFANFICTGSLFALSITALPVLQLNAPIGLSPACRQNLTNFAEYKECSKALVLPLTLIEFRATKNNTEKADLMWKTAQEMNVSHFNIERSTDGRTWVKIGAKSATGQQGAIQTYNYKDNSPSKDINYYRLQVVDHDYKSDYSPVRLLVFGDPKPIRIYPTLARSNSTFYVEGISPEITLVEIYNTEGRLLQKIKLYSNSFTMPYLSPGTYHTRIVNTSNFTAPCQQKIVIH